MPGELAPLTPTALEITALGGLAIVAAAALGYLSDKGFGAFSLALRSLIATLICLGGYIGFARIGYFSFATPSISRARGWAAAGLVIAIIIVGGLGAHFGRNLGGSEPGKKRGTVFVVGLWVGFCFASWIGHKAGSWVGLLTIALPAMTIFWLALYYLVHFILPLDEDQAVSTALRCLLTFSAGTNYPYYAIENREKVECVPGNQTGMFFSGPGIVLTGPDHVVALSNNLKFTGVRGPGVVFTKQWEVIQEPIDLRPQQRAYDVEAIAKDGIRVKVRAFGMFQLDAGRRQPELGRPFPFRAEAVFKAFRTQVVDIRRGTHAGEVIEERKQCRWDELYEIIGTHVVQDIIARYEFDKLCEPLELDKDPRKDIIKEYQEEMRERLPEYGIRALGGGLSDLLPADRDPVLERRIMNWQAQWQRKVLKQLGAAEAEAERLIGQARAQVQADMIQYISEALAAVATDDRESLVNTVSLRFIQSLNQMIAQPHVKDHLPPGVARTVDRLPHIIGDRLGG